MTTQKKRGHPVIELIAGGTAGMCEALVCHPLDTIKVRMQLRAKNAKQITTSLKPGIPAAAVAAAATPSVTAAAAAKPLGFIATGVRIVHRETPIGLYKGLGAVMAGITPKMAIRFFTYEQLKRNLVVTNPDGTTKPLSTSRIFVAGLGAGFTEAVVVVNPMEVVKIRLQAQAHSLADPVNAPKYQNALHCAYSIVKNEGITALYRGVALTAARQASNQGVNFTVYTLLKQKLKELQPDRDLLPSYQTSFIGLISGALGPLSNAPLDTIKTRMQREHGVSSESGFSRFSRITRQLIREEGTAALYKGITPRVMRVAPGQAVVFSIFEAVKSTLEKSAMFKEHAKLD